MTTEEEKLVTKFSDQAFRGQTIRQKYPSCQCGKVFSQKDLCDAPGVFFRDVDVFGRTFTLIEPICPVCKQKIPASYSVLN